MGSRETCLHPPLHPPAERERHHPRQPVPQGGARLHRQCDGGGWLSLSPFLTVAYLVNPTLSCTSISTHTEIYYKCVQVRNKHSSDVIFVAEDIMFIGVSKTFLLNYSITKSGTHFTVISLISGSINPDMNNSFGLFKPIAYNAMLFQFFMHLYTLHFFPRGLVFIKFHFAMFLTVEYKFHKI